MIREILRAGGITIAWTLSSAAVVLLPPRWGALFAVGITILFLAVHAGLPFERGNAVQLAAARVRSLPGLRSWVVAVVILTPVWGLALAFVYDHLVYIPELPSDIFLRYSEQEGGWLPVMILVVLFGPIVEEFGLRGWIQGSLERRLSPAPAIMSAAFLFALMHGSPEGLLLFFAIGCIFGWAAWQSGSIWAAILLHASYNGSLVLAYALTDSPVAVLPPFFERDVGGGTLAMLGLVGTAAVGGVVLLGRNAARLSPCRPMSSRSTNGCGDRVVDRREVCGSIQTT